MKNTKDHFRGCLLGGAIGDALGWPVEFLRYQDILHRYGIEGITELPLNPKAKAEITDDTQMTLFTAEGILRGFTSMKAKGTSDDATSVFYAYQRWFLTQGEAPLKEFDGIYDGWLLGIGELHSKRAPGSTCLSALRSGNLGTMNSPLNNSKGCGGVMRVAPAGLFYQKEEAFTKGAEFAALTHGHASGYLSAGALAYLIATIVEGDNLEDAVQKTIHALERWNDHEECSQLLKDAHRLSKENRSDYEAIQTLGEGWVGEEALAISVYCALKYQDDFASALHAAVNYDGDSDSTGAITGNILGAYLGVDRIPTHWVEQVELGDVLIQIADDLLIGKLENQVDEERYPVNRGDGSF